MIYSESGIWEVNWISDFTILWDKLYKKKLKKIKNIDLELNKIIKSINRQCLHAKSLEFLHPIKNKKMFFESKFPDDFSKIIKKLRSFNK